MDLRVLTHSGEDLVITVDTYDATNFEMKLNDNTLNAVKIGDTLFSRIDLKLIKPLPVTEPPVDEPIEEPIPPTEEQVEEIPTTEPSEPNTEEPAEEIPTEEISEQPVENNPTEPNLE